MIMVKYYWAFGDGLAFIGEVTKHLNEGYWVDGKNSRGEKDHRYILTESIRNKMATVLYHLVDYEKI